MGLCKFVLALAALTLSAPAAGAEAAPVRHFDTTVNGVEVDRYIWRDSKGLLRSVSLKKQGNGNPGHGGYAVQMTYEVREGASVRRVVANATPGGDGGFGYFVSHERYRYYT